MKKFEICFMSNLDPTSIPSFFVIAADFIEWEKNGCTAMRYDDEACEPFPVAWFREVFYWREINEKT